MCVGLSTCVDLDTKELSAILTSITLLLTLVDTYNPKSGCQCKSRLNVLFKTNVRRKILIRLVVKPIITKLHDFVVLFVPVYSCPLIL